MEKLRPILAALKKYYFWVCAVVVILVGVPSWLMSTSNLDKARADREQEIESGLSAVRQIASTPNHPNGTYETEMQKWLQKYRVDIDEAWEAKWEVQQKVLTWPTELNTQNKNFADAINGILAGRPIEALPEEDKGLPVSSRELYRDYIKDELPKLAKVIHSKWAPSGGSNIPQMGGNEMGPGGFQPPGGGFNPSGEPREPPPLVYWNPTNQANIQSKSFDWSAGSGNAAGLMTGGMESPGMGGGGAVGGKSNLPSTREVMYAQENLWVLENLMKIIAKTNGDITSAHQASIKAIESIEFGREVMPIQSKVIIPRSPATGLGDGTEMGLEDPSMMSEDPSMMEGNGMMGEDGMPMDGVMPNPGDFRYVDKDYKKLKVEDLRAATTEPTSENYYLSVAKRLPVRMRLKMDQREIDKLLVECGNADLMVEVRQVRVGNNLPAAGSGGMGMGGAPGMGGGMPPGMGPSMEMGGFEEPGMGGGPGMGGPNGNQEEQAEKVFDVTVEIYGIIYIYNPVNKKLLWPNGQPTDSTNPDGSSTETAGVSAINR
ncbi:hypothetical protein GC197_09445 [bacterium]|nr:hypothetical protein [bacterium]